MILTAQDERENLLVCRLVCTTHLLIFVNLLPLPFRWDDFASRTGRKRVDGPGALLPRFFCEGGVLHG